MPNISRQEWRLIYGTTPTDFKFEVIAPVNWRRTLKGRVAENPCSGLPTIITRGDGATPGRRNSVTVYLAHFSDRDDRLQRLLELWTAIGPYVLYTPRDNGIAVAFDPATWQENWGNDGSYQVQVGFIEVDSAVAVLP